MGQPMSQTEIALEEFRQAGVPIDKVSRPYLSKRMTGFNAEVYSTWIERWATNAAANYPVVKGSMGVNFLRNAAKDIPAVVVAIGPSLDESINDLKKAPRHAVVIATDAALRPLLRHGIRPDIVLNFDARDHQPTMWETIDTSPYILLANSVTSPHTIAAWKGSVMFFNMMQSDDEFASNILPAIYPYLGQLPNMGTVGNGAIFLAYHMGCKPIITVGMDLCYGLDTFGNEKVTADSNTTILGYGYKYRAKDWRFIQPTAELPEGAWEQVENKILYDNDQRIKESIDEEIKGKLYKTDEPLKMYRNSLVAAVGKFDIPIINCSGGVLSDLVKTMTLKNALEQKCYASLEPARTVVKHLKALVPAANHDWQLVPDARIFIPKLGADLWSRQPKEVQR